MTAGMAAHPEWYEGLNRSSAFEEFQQRVFWSNGSLCPEPCAPAPRSGGELFCFAVARMDDSDGADSSSADSEEGLLRAQLGRGAGIFACDDHAVLSDVDKVLGDLAAGPVRTVRIPSTKPDGITKDGTAQNTQIFLQAWETIRKDSRYLSFDWTVKVDPDAVLVPSRLRGLLAPGALPENPFPPPYEADSGSGWWVTNCDMEGMLTEWGNGWPMMYGAAEVLSREATRVWLAGVEECKTTIDWTNVGEDAFIGLCLRQLRVGELFLKMGDKRCGGATCSDADKFVFHDFKSPDDWLACWDQTQEQR